MKKKLTVFMAALLIGLSVLTGCAGNGIEGTWELYEEIEPSGNKLSQEDLKEIGVAETYVIEGDKVYYTCETELMSKPIEIEFELEDLGSNQYNFILNGGFVFANPTVKGNTMTYDVGVEGDISTMIFKRVK